MAHHLPYLAIQCFINEWSVPALAAHKFEREFSRRVCFEHDEISIASFFDCDWIDFCEASRFGGITFHQHVPAKPPVPDIMVI